jgi:ribose transport system substrate-binding protein
MRHAQRTSLLGLLVVGTAMTAIACGSSDNTGGGTSASTSAAAAGAGATGSAEKAQKSCNSVKGKADGATIAYMPPGLEFPYYIGIGEGVKMEAKRLGAKTFTLGPQSGADYAAQASMMRDVIHRGVDGIIFHTHNNSAVAPLVKQASDQGIAVVIVNQDVLSFPAPVNAVVGYKERKTDEKMGRHAVDIASGKAKIGIIEGLPGYDSTERVGGFLDGIKGSPDMKVVAKSPGGWDVQGGNKTAQDMLQAHPEIDMIFAANDYMAEGAYQAAKALHRTNVKILGSDGDTRALELVNQGTQYQATMNTVPVKQGQTAMQVMSQCLKHAFKGFYTETPGDLVTKDNALQVLKDYDQLWPKPEKRY